MNKKIIIKVKNLNRKLRYKLGKWEYLVYYVFVYLVFTIGFYIFGNFNGIRENNKWIDMFYFSGTTLTTLGYGDIQPLGLTKIFSILESFLGVFIFALYIKNIGDREKEKETRENKIENIKFMWECFDIRYPFKHKESYQTTRLTRPKKIKYKIRDMIRMCNLLDEIERKELSKAIKYRFILGIEIYNNKEFDNDKEIQKLINENIYTYEYEQYIYTESDLIEDLTNGFIEINEKIRCLK